MRGPCPLCNDLGKLEAAFVRKGEEAPEVPGCPMCGRAILTVFELMGEVSDEELEAFADHGPCGRVWINRLLPCDDAQHRSRPERRDHPPGP